MRIRSLTVKREFYRDRYNQNKVWEVARLAGGYYLRQYVKGQQFGTGLRTSRKFIESIGIFEFEKVGGILPATMGEFERRGEEWKTEAIAD